MPPILLSYYCGRLRPPGAAGIPKPAVQPALSPFLSCPRSAPRRPEVPSPPVSLHPPRRPMNPCRLAPQLGKPGVLSGRHLLAAPRLHCAALHPVAAPHSSPCSPPHLPPPPRLLAKRGSSHTAAWGRTGRRHWHCRCLAVAAEDGGGTAAEAQRAPPRRAAAVRAAGRRAAAGTSQPSAVARGRRPPAAPHRPPLPPG